MKLHGFSFQRVILSKEFEVQTEGIGLYTGRLWQGNQHSALSSFEAARLIEPQINA